MWLSGCRSMASRPPCPAPLINRRRMSGVTRESVGLIVALIADTLPEVRRGDVRTRTAEAASQPGLALG